jgi:hypothetical protein
MQIYDPVAAPIYALRRMVLARAFPIVVLSDHKEGLS